MPKFSIEVDTDTGTLEVTAAGKKVENVCSVGAEHYKYFDYDKNEMVSRAYVNVMCNEKDDSGIFKMTRMSAEVNKGVDEAAANYLGD